MADGKPPARNSYHSFAAKPLRNEVNMERLAKIYRKRKFPADFKTVFILLMSRLFMLVLMVIYNVYMGTDRSIAF